MAHIVVIWWLIEKYRPSSVPSPFSVKIPFSQNGEEEYAKQCISCHWFSLITHCSQIFIFRPKIQLWFPKKIVDLFEWKTRENVVVLDFFVVENFDLTRKIVKKKLGEKLVKMLGVLSKLNFWTKIWLLVSYNFENIWFFAAKINFEIQIQLKLHFLLVI